VPTDLTVVLKRTLRAALHRRAWQEAGSVLERLKRADPLSLETRGLELELLVRSGRLAEALGLAAQLTQLFPASGRIHYLAGQLHYRRKAYARAEQHFREGERIYPHPWVRRYLGKTLTQLGRFDEAEAVLARLADEGREVWMDLAWLFERRGDYARALRMIDHRLATRPDDAFAQGHRRRLRAKFVPPAELVQEIETLKAFGEDVPEDLLPEFIGNLLRSGQKQKAREVLERLDPKPAPRLSASLGWVCHQLQAYDLAMGLFLRALPEHWGNPKFLSALERAADRCDRLDELLVLYDRHAPEAKHLYGRAISLRRRINRPEK
jgi:tetratricopeptide (TPR) repeat protein